MLNSGNCHRARGQMKPVITRTETRPNRLKLTEAHDDWGCTDGLPSRQRQKALIAYQTSGHALITTHANCHPKPTLSGQGDTCSRPRHSLPRRVALCSPHLTYTIDGHNLDSQA